MCTGDEAYAQSLTRVWDQPTQEIHTTYAPNSRGSRNQHTQLMREDQAAHVAAFF